jgi:hypothetical protein
MQRGGGGWDPQITMKYRCKQEGARVIDTRTCVLVISARYRTFVVMRACRDIPIICTKSIEVRQGVHILIYSLCFAK